MVMMQEVCKCGRRESYCDGRGREKETVCVCNQTMCASFHMHRTRPCGPMLSLLYIVYRASVEVADP